MTGTVWLSWTATASGSSGMARTTWSRAAPRQKVSNADVKYSEVLFIFSASVATEVTGSKDKEDDDKDSDRYLVKAGVF